MIFRQVVSNIAMILDTCIDLDLTAGNACVSMIHATSGATPPHLTCRTMCALTMIIIIIIITRARIVASTQRAAPGPHRLTWAQTRPSAMRPSLPPYLHLRAVYNERKLRLTADERELLSNNSNR